MIDLSNPQVKSRMQPLNFKKWIADNRHLLKPPVGNQQIWLDTDFLITVVGGPNSRTDYHINQGEEFFYQVEGTINLKLWIDGHPQDFAIAEGEIFLLPPNIPHSPQRPAGTVGLVIERKRQEKEIDSLVWFCEKCHEQVYKESFHLTDIVKQFPPLFDRVYNTPANCTCKKCGTKIAKDL